MMKCYFARPDPVIVTGIAGTQPGCDLFFQDCQWVFVFTLQEIGRRILNRVVIAGIIKAQCVIRINVQAILGLLPSSGIQLQRDTLAASEQSTDELPVLVKRPQHFRPDML